MALYYTLDEMVDQITSELNNLDNYLQMLNAIIIREQQSLGRGDTIFGAAGIETDLEKLMVEADKVLEDVVTNLGNIDFTKYAFEIRAGVGSYHHAFISIVTPALTSWTITSNNPEGVAFAVFETLLSATDTVEIFNVGDSDLEGFFVIIGNTTSSIQLAEADHLSEAQEIPTSFSVIVRLRETA